jgi:hypothetical protein
MKNREMKNREMKLERKATRQQGIGQREADNSIGLQLIA